MATTSISSASFSLSKVAAKIALCAAKRSNTQPQETLDEEGLNKDSAIRKEKGKEEPKKPDESSSVFLLERIHNPK